MQKTLVLLIFFISVIFPQTDEYKTIADKIIKTALSEKKGYNMLADFCKIDSRLSGSANSMKAIKWCESKMKEMGFDSVWLQPVKVPHWERGNIEKGAIVSGMFKKKLNISSYGGSIGTDKKGITANVIEVSGIQDLKVKKDLVRGKIVFFNRPLDNSLADPFEGYGGAVDQRFAGAIWAGYFGAAAVLVRSITTLHDNITHVGSMAYVDSVTKIPSTTIGNLDADYLSLAIKTDKNLKINIKLDCKTFPDADSYNVIGEIKGTSLPNEIVVVGGHTDCWDKGQGAHDDGAGSMQSIEALYLLKRNNISPKRTIRCVLFINEENGDRGGIEYGKLAATQNHVAAIESDRGGFTPKGFDFASDSLTIATAQKWLPILNLSGIDFIRKGYGGVDISKIKNAKALIGYVPDAQRYMDVHHSDNDTFDKVNARELELGSASIAILAYLISQNGL